MPRHNGKTVCKRGTNKCAKRRRKRREEAMKGKTPRSEARTNNLLPEQVYDFSVSESNEDAD